MRRWWRAFGRWWWWRRCPLTQGAHLTTTEVLYKPAKTDSIVTSARNYLVGSAYQIFQNGQGISTTCALKYHSCAVIIDRVKNLRVVLKTYFSVLFSAVLCRICPLPRPRQRRSPGSPGRCPPGPPPCPQLQGRGCGDRDPGLHPQVRDRLQHHRRHPPARRVRADLRGRHLHVSHHNLRVVTYLSLYVHMMCILKIISQLTF